MARVLLAWELGSGLWHPTVLRTLGRALAGQGHDVVYAVADPVGAGPVLGAEGVVLQAPVHRPLPRAPNDPFAANDFADILDEAGFGDPAWLGPLVAAWDGLLGLVRPDVLVADHSPTALLAARGRIPAVQVGLGFSIPPSGDRMPRLRDGPERGSHERILASVAAVRPGVDRVPALFDTPRFVCTLPELDPYRRPTVGPVEALPSPLPKSEPRWHAYLAASDPRTPLVLEGLRRTRLPGTVYLGGARREWVDGLRRDRFSITLLPPPIHEVLRRTAVVVHHGGVGTIHQAVAAGRAQAMLPRHLEQEGNVNAVVARGGGVALGSDPDTIALAVLAAFGDPFERARAWAAELVGRPDAAAIVAEAIASAG